MKPRRQQEQPARKGVSPLLVCGLVLLAITLVLGGLFGWRYWGANPIAAKQAQSQVEALRAGWAERPPAEGDSGTVERPGAHEVAWVLRIPSLGLEWPIVAGVEPADLAVGVGWYPGSALPGQVGNFALAGHRVVGGAPFGDLLELALDDQILIETPTATYTYTVISAPADLTVGVNDAWVLDPVPGRPEEVPSQAFITLTTSEDLVDTPDRSVGFGTLTATETP